MVSPNCVRRICGGLSGRLHHDELPLLTLGSAEPSATAISQAADKGLYQVRSLRQQFLMLAPVLEKVLSPVPAGIIRMEASLAAIASRLNDLEAILVEAGHACESPQLSRCSASESVATRHHEVVPCIVSEGEGSPWSSGRILLSDAGIAFDKDGLSQSMESISWSDVLSVTSRSPTGSSLSPCSNTASCNVFISRSSGSLLDEVELMLRRPPGKLRLQFGVLRPTQSVDKLWRAAGEQSHATVSIDCPYVAEFKRLLGPPPTDLCSVYTTTIPGRATTIAAVRSLLLRDDSDCVLMRLWEGAATDVEMSPWEPLGSSGDRLCRFTFRVQLKPQPFAPKSTRVIHVYHLDVGHGVQPLALNEMSISLDVPFSNCFAVMGRVVFTEAPAPTADPVLGSLATGGITVEKFMGVRFSQRVVMKGLIERNVMKEAPEYGVALVRHLSDKLVQSSAAQQAVSQGA